MYFDVKVYNLGANSVTRAFFEIVEFFSKNLGKIVKKTKIVLKKVKFHVYKIQFIGFFVTKYF